MTVVRERQTPDISIHAPAWGATTSFVLSGMKSRFQSTRPRGARLDAICALVDTLQISIHAPAWGATAARLQAGMTLDISIHAPAWGATPPRTSSRRASKISIHAPAWGATHVRRFRRARRVISIHAPAWGATSEGSVPVGAHGFQSTRPRGARRSVSCANQLPLYFNPRARVGRDALLRQSSCARQYFNPRARVGRDELVLLETRLRIISIHAPAWGATVSA